MSGGQLPELASEGRLLIRGEVLIPEEDDEMVRKCGSHHRDDLWIEGFRQVEAGYLGTDDRR